MALRARQEQQLHLAIALYLESKFPEAYRVFEREAHVDFSAATALTHGSEKFDSETLPKRWGATARLQARVTVLQNQLQQQGQQLKLFTSAACNAGNKKAAGLPGSKPSYVISAQRQPVTCCVFHPLLPQLLIGADDGNVRVISVEGSGTGTITRTFRAHHASVTGLAFDPSGRWLVTCSSDMTLRLFDVQTSYTLKETLRGHDDSVSAIAFFTLRDNKGRNDVAPMRLRGLSNGGAADGDPHGNDSGSSTCIISCSRDGLLKLWDAETGLCLRTFTPVDTAGAWGVGGTAGSGGSWVRCLCVPEAKLRPAPFFASGGNDQRVVIWRPDFTSAVRELVGHQHVIESVTFATEAMLRHMHDHRMAPPPLPSSMLDTKALLEAEGEGKTTHALRIAGLVLISASRDKTIKMWDVIGGSCIQTLVGHDNWVRQVVVHPTGEHIISCSDDRSIRTWNVLTGDCERTIEGAHSQFVTCLDYDLKTDILASASLDATVKLWPCRVDDAKDPPAGDESTSHS
ncbi:WD-40 repeat protein, putative [Eimeria tenella]|uniref:WD-40 repeat protein, putative n=1 Tax=Eimeria tenella TaxID=5802 RepID=U6KTF8_EIMTE|nr:WD-40 repeat protein, putative [Eimeria tenella]CDJ39654.1 WD-40 repeat protein, putative [Eimeria tenella]|eukprot:XP_013230409.1 WD-40 repeat protein, putative [Eimeria tenella]